jgi:hypothetical protein
MQLNIPSIDIDVETDGKWFTYKGSIRFKIARIGNDAYKAGAAAMYELSQAEKEDLSAEQQASMMAELYSRYILMDWDGVVDINTSMAVEYTPAVGMDVLLAPKHKDLLSFILRQAGSIDNYWQEVTQETGKK